MTLNLRDIDAPASAERFAERMQELTERGEVSFQADHMRKDGSNLPMDVSIRRTNWGEVDAILSIASDITERQRSEKALVESQVLTNAIMDSTSDLIWSVDALDFRILTFNTALSQHFLEDRGITLQVGMLSEDIYPTAEFVYGWKEYYQRAISAGPYTTEYQVFSKKKFLQLTFNLLKRDGRVFGISVFGKDITERKRAEQAVLESEDRFRAVVQTANDAIITIDGRGAIVDWNMAAETIFGFSAAEALGMPVERIVPGKFQDSHQQGVQSAFSSQERQVVGSTAEVRGLTKAGREFPVEMSLASWKTQAGVFFTAVIRDISERKGAEERIRSSERKFRELFHDNKDGISIFLLGPDGKPGNFVECNTAAHQMLGYTRQELLNLTPLTLEPHTPQEVMQARQAEFSVTGVTNFETVIQHKDGHPVFTEFTAQLITYEGQPAIMNIVRDVSERKLAEDALRESEEKYRTVADFTYAWETWRAPNGECLYVSPSCERISGHSPAQFLSDENLTVRITHPDDRSRVLAHFRENMEQVSEQDQELVFRIILPDGEIRWLSHNCTAVYAADGHWLGRRESNRDITEHKQRENELEAISILSTALRTAPNRAEMLPVIVRELGSLMHCDVIAVVMVDPVTDENVVEAASGAWAVMKGARLPAADGLNGVVRATRKAYH
ncbi:MAG: PAS domain S-box protein, partial [Chloroflexota bacterium]